MNILYFYLFLLVHPYLSLWWKSFEQAGRKSWEALIPGYNYFIAFRIGCQKPWWSLLMIFPGVHLAIWSVAITSYILRFVHYSLVDTLQGVFFPYIIMAKIAKSTDDILPETNWANSGEMGKREWGDHLALFLALPVIGHAIALGIGAVTRHKPGKKSKVKEWGDSLIFALVAASIIRTYVFEPFQIPTGSMEKTLLVGDFLFVNKLAYGAKVPVTPLSYPLVHNTVPWVNIKSYTSLEKTDYTRLPGFSNIERYDVVVFNYPSGDTAIYDPRMPNGLMGHDYHGYVLNEAMFLYETSDDRAAYYSEGYNHYKDSIEKVNPSLSEDQRMGQKDLDSLAKNYVYKMYLKDLDKWKEEGRKYLASGKAHDMGGGPIIEHYGVIYRPVDKRENYIKRCVGIPGDWMEIKESVLFVNGKPAKVAEFQNLRYKVFNIKVPTDTKMVEKYGLEKHRGGTVNGDFYFFTESQNLSYWVMDLTDKQLKKLQKDFPDAQFVLDIVPQYSDDPSIKPTAMQMVDNLGKFPKDASINNTNTDFTKFQIPFKGQKIKIDKSNIAWYRRIITAYEGHKLQEKKDGIYIDGKKTSTYTFGMNYYWMMGDNRYNSADSRVWGFVPEDHIVGKASMVWFSKDPYQGVRWDRMFNIIE